MVKLEPWQVQRTLSQTIKTFPEGKEVRHLNPDLSDWRGVVTGTRRDHKWIKCNGPATDPGWISVRVRWYAGEIPPPHTMPVTGWYAATALAPA